MFQKTIRKAFLVSLISFQAMASVPTLEGLLRNPSNKEVLTDTVSLAIRISEDSASPMSGINSKDGNSLAPSYIYQKIYWRVQDSKPDSIVLLTSKDPTFGENALITVREYSFKEYVQKMVGNVEQSLLMSIFNIISLNSPEMMIKLMRSTSPEIKLNRELINKETEDYLSSYKRAHQERKDKKEKVTNPEDPYSTSALNKNLNNRFYNPQDQLKLIRSSDSFVWQYENDKFIFEFDNMNYKMRRMNYINMEENISLKIGDYVLFDGQHEIPKYIVFQKGEYKRYKIDLLEYKNLSLRPNDFQKRVGKLKDIVKTHRNSLDEMQIQLLQL